MKKRRWLPFELHPVSWGLRGRLRQEARAQYYLSGDALQKQLQEIDTEHRPDDDPVKQQRHLDAQLAQGKIDRVEHEKQSHTLRGEPWVTVKHIDIDADSAQQGAIELDWNSLFVEQLEAQGYGPAPEEAQVVDEWLTELCRNVALEKYDGVGEFSEKVQDRDSTTHSDVIYREDLK